MAIMKVSPRSFICRRLIMASGFFSFVVVILCISRFTSTHSSLEGGSILTAPSHFWNSYTEPTSEEESLFFNQTLPQELESVQQKSNMQIPAQRRNSRSSESRIDTLDKISGSVSAEVSQKKIFIWNRYWESTALWNKIFFEIVHKQCPQSNCVITTDSAQMNSSDAVLFHLVDIAKDNYKLPQYRNPNQIWIGMTYEPPYILEHMDIELKRLNGLFNRTMSYRTDGDIVVRHGTYSKIQGPPTATYASNWFDSRDPIEKRNYAEGKKRLVAWFASSRNCKSASGRETYVAELQNYIQVDVYGSCGPYKCGEHKTMRHPYKVEHDDCYMLVSVGYKFVLAFENSLCEDYVTEKLYNNLKLNVVPVVLGASNYSVFAPPHSVIEASQYTPEALSKYLQYLDKNDTAYNEYFRWKQDYQIESHDGVPLACDLCEQLHNPNWQTERKVYEQFDKWLVGGCRKGYGESS